MAGKGRGGSPVPDKEVYPQDAQSLIKYFTAQDLCCVPLSNSLIA